MTTLKKAHATLDAEIARAHKLTTEARVLKERATAIVVAALQETSAAASSIQIEFGVDEAEELREAAQDVAHDFAYTVGLEFDGDIEDPCFWEPSTC